MRFGFRNITAIISVVFKPAHLRRTVLIAIVVGSWLTVVNLCGPFLAEGLTLSIVAKVAVNFLTPFTVANAGLLAHTENEPL